MQRRRFPLAKSIATVSHSRTLPEKLEAAAAVGFDCVEIFEADLLAFDGSLADVRGICDGLGLTITLYRPFRDFKAMPEPVRARNLDRSERKFDAMQALGAGLLLVCSNVQPTALGDDARAAAGLATMTDGRSGGACVSATRRSPGAAMSPAGGTPGASCSRLPTRPSA